MTDRFSLLRLTLVLLWLVLTTVGCATTRPLPMDEVPVAAADGEALLAMWLERSEALQSLQGLAKVRVKTDQGSMSGTQVVIAAKPNQLRAETLGPFGNPLLSLATDGKQLTVFIPGDNLFFTGAATAGNLTRFTRVPLPAAALIDILLWQPPLMAFAELTAFRTAGDGWRLLLVDGPLRQELIFDAAERLQSVRYFSGETPQLLVNYAGFADAALPRQILLEQPPFAMQASLNFSELTINQPLPAGCFSLAPPAGIRIVPLDESAAGGGHLDGAVPVLSGRE